MKKKKPVSIEKLGFNIVGEEEEPEGRPENDAPLRVAIFGDFSGHRNPSPMGTGSSISQKRLHRIDRDNLEEVMERLGVAIEFPVSAEGQPPLRLQFAELDDFHPDRIFDRFEAFRGLKEDRRKFLHPQRGTDTSREDRSATRKPVEPLHSDLKMPGLTTAGLLDEVVEATETGAAEAGPAKPKSEWESFLQETVKPHLVPSDAEEKELIGSVEAISGKLMRAILHDPGFQAIEAAWRAVRLLTYGLETDAGIEIYIADVSKSELAADLRGARDVTTSGLYRLLAQKAGHDPETRSWAVIAGNFTFDPTPEDLNLLSGMSKIASRLGAPFLSAASPRFLGTDSLSETPDPDGWKMKADSEGIRLWKVLRQAPEASYLGLALPRFLLRLPYGNATDPIETFDFEEMPSHPTHDHYLWGNPCFACVYLLAEAFSRNGWDLRPGAIQEIEGLPVHVYGNQGESGMTPCAEAFLSHRAAEIILDQGIMPLLSFKDRDAIRLGRFQSIADPPTALAGPWGN
jgi:type VI secretion system protein ImpC